MSVKFQKAEYIAALKSWELVDDVCKGEERIKKAGVKYLPKPNPFDKSEENTVRYEQYLDRAVFYNATGRTLKGLIGAVYREKPEAKFDGLEYLLSDADGKGVSIHQQSQSTLASVLKKGRSCLYVDYPQVDGETTKADLDNNYIRASILNLPIENIWNWQTTKVGGVHKLSLVVIAEVKETLAADGFEVELENQYRVLRLEDGIYTVQVFTESKEGLDFQQAYAPKNQNGQFWKEIPFTFVGAQNNDLEIDDSPLYDLATINIAHYRNSADFEDSVYLCGQVQPYVTGADEQWVNLMEAKGMYVGSRKILAAPQDGTFGFAQANPNTLVGGAMQDKERQMIALGAQLVNKGQAVKTATEAQAENEAQHSVLSLAASNVSDAYTKALRWVSEFMGTTDDVLYELNTDFFDHSVDAQMLSALVTTWQSGAITDSHLWGQFRKAGIVNSEETDEQIREQLDVSNSGLNLEGIV